MKKRTLVLLLCLALASVLAVDETLAQQASGLFRSLTHWLGDTLGIPQASPAELRVELESTSQGVLTPSHYPQDDFDWAQVGSGTALKTTWAHNAATEGAYVRICIAVKEVDVLHVRQEGDVSAYRTHVRKNVDVGGEKFTLYTYDYTAELLPGKTTPVITHRAALAKETTNAHIQQLGDDFVMAQSFAIQASAFKHLDDAGNPIPEDDQTTPPMRPETALDGALGPIADFNPFN